MVGRDAERVFSAINELTNYVDALKKLDADIASGKKTAQKEKADLQRQALENIVITSARDLAQLQEHLKGLESNSDFKENAQAVANKIAQFLNETLLGFNVNPFLRTEAETKQVTLDETKEVKSFLTQKEFSKFGNAADSLATTLKTQPENVGAIGNFSDYKQFNDYITKFDGFDTNLMINSKNISDDEMLTFAQKVSKASFDIAQAVGDRYEKLEKITPRTAKIAAELRFLDGFYNKLLDGLAKWGPIEEAYNDKIMSNRELKEPRTIRDKIIDDNKNATTQKAKLNDIFTNIQDEQATLFSGKRSDKILAPNEFIKSYKAFQHQLAEFLKIIND